MNRLDTAIVRPARTMPLHRALHTAHHASGPLRYREDSGRYRDKMITRPRSGSWMEDAYHTKGLSPHQIHATVNPHPNTKRGNLPANLSARFAAKADFFRPCLYIDISTPVYQSGIMGILGRVQCPTRCSCAGMEHTAVGRAILLTVDEKRVLLAAIPSEGGWPGFIWGVRNVILP